MIKSHTFWILFFASLGWITEAQAVTGLEASLSEGKIHLSWIDEGHFIQIEQTESISHEAWKIVASQVSGDTFSIETNVSEAFFRVTNQGLRFAAPLFGCDMDSEDCSGPSFPPWCFEVRAISDWHEPNPANDIGPLKFDFWKGPYQNKAGFDAVSLVNDWFHRGEAAGLGQDTFRSFDSGHSSIRDFYPQMQRLEPVSSYDADCRDVFKPGVTFGVQSLAVSADSVGEGLSVIDFNSLTELLYHYHRAEYQRLVGSNRPVFTREFYRQFFESNVLIVSPAVKSFTVTEEGDLDRFTFLSPYYVHSVGLSGSDRRLLKPLLFAAASLPRELKTRILRAGMQTPVLLWLLKQALSEDLETSAVHVPALSLPDEADYPPPKIKTFEDGSKETIQEAYLRAPVASAPFLERLLNSAHRLEHIPPVARIKHEIEPQVTGGGYTIEPFVKIDPYSVHAVLRPGEQLALSLDLSLSWTDNRLVKKYHVNVLRDPGNSVATQMDLNKISDGKTKITIPWQSSDSGIRRRTDILLQVSDGTYDSFPAYISVRHLQEEDRELFNF